MNGMSRQAHLAKTRFSLIPHVSSACSNGRLARDASTVW
jgi:hypothetical protein